MKDAQSSSQHSHTSSERKEQGFVKIDMKRMSNGHRVKLFFNRFIQQQMNVGLSLLGSLILIYSYYEYDFDCEQGQNSKVFLYTILLSLIFIITSLILRFNAFNELKKSQLKQNQMLGPFSIAIEVLVVLIQPYPFLQSLTYDTKNYADEFVGPYKVNYVLVLMSFFRIALIFPIACRYSKYLTPRATRICRMYGSEPNFHYTIKCMFKQRPIQLIITWFALSILLFSLAFRISQRGILQKGTTNQQSYFSNSLWLTIITMTTVGYGDLYPNTDLGRIVGLLCMFWGGFTISVMVVVLANTLNLDQRQKRSLVILKRLQMKKEIRIIAAKFIRESMWRLWRNYKNREYGMQFDETTNERNLKKQFNHLRRLSKNSLMDVDIHQDMARHFQRIQAHIQTLKNNAQNLINYINEEYFKNMHSNM